MNGLASGLLALALAFFATQASAQSPVRGFPPGTFQSRSALDASSGAPTTGPGDIVSGAKVWWGLRCYATATAGTKAVRLVRASDSTQQDINSLPNCSLDVSSATTFCNATTCKAVTLYDQSGANNCSGAVACDITQGIDANRPAFTFNCIGSKACLTFSGAASTILTSATNGISVAQPSTISQVMQRTANFTTQMEVINSADCTGTFFANATNSAAMFAQTSVVSATAADSSFHAGQFVFNGASSTINVDGITSSPGNPGVTPFGNVLAVSMGGGGCGSLSGTMTEGGVWPIGFSAGQQTSMNANQHAAWGF